MAKKVILKDYENDEILPITRGELVLDSSGKEAFHSNEFLATQSLPGLMSEDDKQKLDELFNTEVDDSLSYTSTNPVQNKVVSTAIKDITDSYLKSANVNGNKLTIKDQNDDDIDFYNTTYSFQDGTNGSFTVNTSDGETQIVKVGGILTDDKVKLTISSDNTDYRVLFSYTADDTTRTEGSRKSSKLKFNPYSGTLATTTLIGNLDGTYIDKLTDYEKASEDSDLTVTDSLNTALGKLEYKADTAFMFYKNIMGPDEDDVINKYDEIVNFIDSVKESETDILDTFVTRKTDLDIEGVKSFLLQQNFEVADKAPFTVKSNKKVTNLNADLLDGVHETGFIRFTDRINSENTTDSVRHMGYGYSAEGWKGNGPAISIGAINGYIMLMLQLGEILYVRHGDPESFTDWKRLAYTANPDTNNVEIANAVANKLTLKFDSGTKENNNLYTYDGSASKNINIKAGDNVTLNTNTGSIVISSKNDNTTYSLLGELTDDNSSYTVTLKSSENELTEAVISKMVGATASKAGAAGLVPIPSSGSQNLFLKGDGTWSLPNNTWRNIKVNGTQIAGTGTDTYAINFTYGDGIIITGTSGNSETKVNTINVTNKGVLSVTLGTGNNANDLKINTGGEITYLTIPYATTASLLNNTSVSDPSKAASGLYLKWYSTISQASGYAGNNYGFPVSNNANGILWLGTHSGPYGGLLGISSDKRLYYRFISNNTFPTTANGGSWNKIAWVSDIPTKTSQLTNDSDFINQTAADNRYVNIEGDTMTGLLTLGSDSYNKTIKWANTDYPSASAIAFMGADGDWVVRSTYTSDSNTADLRFNKSTLKINGNIALHTGNSSVSGGGSSVGSSITVNLNGTSKTLTIPATSTNTEYLKIHDIRGTDHLPESTNYPNRYITAWFNSTGTPDNSWYSGLTVRGWTGGYAAWQICSYSSTSTTNNYNLYLRHGNNSTWGSWKTIMDSSNYKDIIGTGSYFKVNDLTTAGTGDIYLEMWRGVNASWKILNTSGILKFLSNYTSSAGSYYDCFNISYNTGDTWIKGRITAPGASIGGYDNTSYALSTPSFICNSWVRTVGPSGWYNESYGGGWYMTDDVYVKSYNNKAVLTSNNTYYAFNSAGGFYSSWNNSYTLNATNTLNPNYATFNKSNMSVGHDTVQPILVWSNLVTNYGYVTKYSISSIRPNNGAWGRIRIAAGNNDAGTSIGTYLDIGNGSINTALSMYAAHFYENSDIQLKTNIQEILNSDKMPIIKEFDWKEDNSHSYGLIAQELEEQGYSELVSTKDDGYKTVNYSAALSLIVGKLQVKIKELEKEIENLKSKN